MSKRWIVILLLLSVAFNLAVLGSFVYLRFMMPYPPHCAPLPDRHPGEFHGRPLRRLLSEDDQFRQARRQFHENKRVFMEELLKDDIDEIALQRILENSLAAQGAMEQRIGYHMIELRKSMSAEEARQFFGRHIERMKEQTHFKSHRYRRNK